MEKEANLTLKDLFILLGFILIVWFLFKIPTALIIFGTGFILFFLIDPIIEWLNGFYNNRPLWVTIVFILLLASVVIAFALFIPLLFKQLKQFPLYVDSINKLLQSTITYLSAVHIYGTTFEISLAPYINSAVDQFNAWLVNSLQNSFQIIIQLFSNIFNFLFAMVVAIYLLVDKENVKKGVLNLMPENIRGHQEKMLSKTLGILSSYFRAILFLGFIIFIISWPALAFMGVPYAFLLALWAGITEMIPYIGPWIGSITAVAVAWIVSPLLGIMVAVFFIIVQFIENAVIVPKVMESELGIHPLVVLFAIFVGAEIYGIIGMVIAVPIAAVIYAGYKYYRENFS